MRQWNIIIRRDSIMRTYRFYKDDLGWFIDLPSFPLNRGYLAMVLGADDLLDKLSKGKKRGNYKNLFQE